MGGISYFTSTLGVLIMAVFGSVLYAGRRAAEELEAWFPYAQLALKHPGIGLGLGTALLFVGTRLLTKRASLLRIAPWR